MTVEKPESKQLLRPTTTETSSAMNQSQFLAITWNWLEAREKSRVQGGIGLGYASHWLENWRESFKAITKRSNRNHVISSVYYLATIIYTSRNNKYIHKISCSGMEGHKKPQGLCEMDLLNPRI